jgi:hypothetical protein
MTHVSSWYKFDVANIGTKVFSQGRDFVLAGRRMATVDYEIGLADGDGYLTFVRPTAVFATRSEELKEQIALAKFNLACERNGLQAAERWIRTLEERLEMLAQSDDVVV